MNKLYYTPPPDKAFEEMKKACIKLWQTYNNEYGYVDEKVNGIKDIKNVGDNFLYMLALFDHINQQKIRDVLSEDTLKEIDIRVPNHVRDLKEALNFFPPNNHGS